MRNVAMLQSETNKIPKRTMILARVKTSRIEMTRNADGTSVSKTYIKPINASLVLLLRSFVGTRPINQPESLPKPEVQDVQ